MKKVFLVGVAALSVFSASAAHAADEGRCAVVLRTSDGFLAMREGPTVQSKMIAKLLRGDYLIMKNESKGAWKHVTEKADNTEGWVHSRYIQEFSCPGEADWNGGPYKENIPRALLGEWCNAWDDGHYERCDGMRRREIQALADVEGYVNVVKITPNGITIEGKTCKGINAYESEGAPAYTLTLKCPNGDKTLRINTENMRKGEMKIENVEEGK